jgi:hypothetical protein
MPSRQVLDAPFDYPPAKAEIALRIDGRESRWPVFLVDGIAVGQLETRTALGTPQPFNAPFAETLQSPG